MPEDERKVEEEEAPDEEVVEAPIPIRVGVCAVGKVELPDGKE